jgi:hypothetical protein
MPTYLCRWPNGDFSVAVAKDEEEAIDMLDEAGSAEKSMLIECSNFQVHFKLAESVQKSDMDEPLPPLQLENFGESIAYLLMDSVYPIYSKANKEIEANPRFTPEERLKRMNEAIAAEKKSIWDNEESASASDVKTLGPSLVM